jgi:hypothetical protein
MTQIIKCPSEFRQKLERELSSDGLRYMLAMFWQGRSDKISSDLMGLLEWLTINGLPSEVVRTWKGCSPGKKSAFLGMDHQDLLDKVIGFATASVKPE